MDFREINTFIHVANQESFSKAADVLVTHRLPSVSRSNSWNPN